MCAQIEDVAIELYAVAKLANIDPREVARALREELFDAGCQAVSGPRRESSHTHTGAYAYKHVRGSPSKEYQLVAQVGAGAFGTVHRARHQQTGEEHALKSVEKGKVDPASLWAEIETMRQLDHPHIMRLYNTFEDDTHIYMALELCCGGSFFDLLSQQDCLQEPAAARLFRQVIGVVCYLHSRSICHRDLKPENFLVLKKVELTQTQVKLIDFGTAKRFDLHRMVTKVCTPHYVAPEVLKKGPVPYSEKVDVWSCGVILFQMLSGHMPFHHEQDLELLRLVKKGVFQFRPERVWAKVSSEVQELISAMLCPAVEARLTADAAFRHSWAHNVPQEDVHVSKQLMKQMHVFITDNRLKRIALRLIARQIDDESIERLRSIFLSMDKDNSGSITRREMEEAVRMVERSEMSQAGMVEIMSQLDPTGSGVVEYTGFLAATMSKEQYLKEDVCRAAFVRLDSDGDGQLTRRDLAKLLTDKDGVRDMGLEGASLSELVEELEVIFRGGDVDHDGGISFEEFMQLMGEETQHFATTALESRQTRGRRTSYTKMIFQSMEGTTYDLAQSDDDEDESEDEP